MKRLMLAAGLCFAAISPLFAAAPAATAPARISAEEFARRVLERAREEVRDNVRYDASYFKMAYPGGDVPADVGACTDLIVRAYRSVGIDLQKEVHDDRMRAPEAYPKNPAGEKSVDTNLDHRRCRHLAVWFRRHAQEATKSVAPEDLEEWRPGDIAFFTFQPGKASPDHVAVVSDRRLPDGVPFVVDQFPPRASERFHLQNFYIHSHFRWQPDKQPASRAAREAKKGKTTAKALEQQSRN